MSISNLNNIYFTYILRCADNTLYTGITTDLERRVFEHNHAEKWAKYTKMRRPVELIYHEKHASRSEACKREYNIKQLTREEKENLLSGSNPWSNLSSL